MRDRALGLRRPTLADLVDFEYRFFLDERLTLREVRERDAALGLRIGSREGDRRALCLRWLDALRAEGAPSPGERVEHARQLVGAILAIVGFSLGASLVGGWLALTREPVNVLYFWAITVGLPLVTLLLWLVAVLPKTWVRWLPGLGGLRALLRAVGPAVPALVARVSGVWPFRAAPRDEWRAFWARLRGLDWVYGPARFWLAVELTQRLVLAFSLGAVGAFVALSYATDPSFGWRSTLLSPSEVHAATQVVSAPWSWAVPGAALTLAEVRDTRYSSLDLRYTGVGWPSDRSRTSRRGEAWAAWWPFLLVSMLFYALVPRLLTNAFSRWKANRFIRRAPLDHADFQKLVERLRRPPVDTRSPTAEEHPPDLALDARVTGPSAPLEGTCQVVLWEGVDLDEPEVRRRVEGRLGTEVGGVFSVGGVDLEPDARVLQALARDAKADAIAVLVEAWEPPSGDYLDFLAELRRHLGKGRIVTVLLFDRDGRGRPAAPSAERSRPWLQRIAAMGDPWLRVLPLVEEEAQ
ncbi:MAG: DUF2868 domain-containing protein [Deltaproteobacteria bacterium]|nr:DUF2868 domain-containing protein [Deltaproteobacteria bacterium]